MNIFINMEMKNTDIFIHITGFINIKRFPDIKLIIPGDAKNIYTDSFPASQSDHLVSAFAR